MARNGMDVQDPEVAVDVVGADDAEGVDRRTFVKRSVLAAAAFALAACAGGNGGPTAPKSVHLTINVADYPALANVDGVALVSGNGTPLAVVRTGDATFVALSRICPHQGGTVQPVGNGFQCPVHGATFNLTGKWVGGQPTYNLTSYKTTYDATAGTLTIG